MSFKRYPAYKDSGVEWLGRVPEGWEVNKISSICTKITNGYVGPTRDIFVESGIRYLQSLHIKNNSIKFDTPYYVTEDWSNNHEKSILRSGDVLVVQTGDIGQVAVVTKEFEGSNCHALIIISPQKEKVSGHWLSQVLNSNYGYHSLISIQTGALHPHLNCGNVKDLYIPFPPLPEQQTIAAFLDHETARIDALIAEQETLIALLKEKRQALISHVVTRGLNPQVKLKDSGVEWLGMVPEGWEVNKISSICTKITNGYVGPTRDIFVESGIRYLQSLHIKNNSIKFDTPYYVTEDWSNNHEKSILRSGDVLVVQTGDIGQVAVVTKEFEGSNCHALIIISPQKEKVSGHWLSQVLNSNYGYHSLISIQTGALHPHLNCGNVKDLYIPFPPLPEQEAIIAFLNHETARIDTLVAEAQKGIELLKERRSALISAAVTGQIDVRDWQAPQPV